MRVEDRLALAELPARYARAIDERDLESLMALFCDDAVFTHGDGRTAATGAAELRRFYAGFMESYDFSVHVPQTHVIEELDGERASGWVLGHAEVAEAGRLGAVAMRYDDEYRKVAGRWQFASRINRFYYFTDWARVGQLGATTDRVDFRGPARPADLPAPLNTSAPVGAEGEVR